MSGHVPLVQTLHPMLPGGGSAITVCARCEEVWPCTVADLLEALKLAHDHLAAVGIYEGSDEIKMIRAALDKAEGR